MKKNYFGSIEITKMKAAIFTTQRGTRCILLPIKENHLHEFAEGRFEMPVNILIHEEKDKYGNSGFIGQRLPSEEYKALTDEQRKEIKLPILGNFKDFSQDSNSKPAQEAITEDDLPF